MILKSLENLSNLDKALVYSKVSEAALKIKLKEVLTQEYILNTMNSLPENLRNSYANALQEILVNKKDKK